MNERNPIETEKISMLFMKFSVPAVIGMVVNALYNIVDRIYIGNAPGIGKSGLAGITVCFPIMLVFLAVGLLFGVGGSTLFAISLGQRKKEKAEEVLGTSFAVLVISGMLILICGECFLSPLLGIFGASEAILPFSEAYLRIIFMGAPFQIAGTGLNNFLRADSKPKLAMISMFAGAGANIILDPLFIYAFRMGIAGAALATILSQLLSFVWILSYFLGKKSSHRLQLRYIRLRKKTVLRITSLGLPVFFLQLSQSLLNVILNRALVQYGGDLAVSGMGVVNSVQTIILMPITGINQGIQPIISFHYGAGKYKRIKEMEKLAIITATVIALLGWVATRLFPAQIVSLFNRDQDLLIFGEHALIIWFMGLPATGFQVIASNFFQSIGRSKTAMFLTLTRQVIILIPAILLFSRHAGIDGILYAAPFADISAAVITGTIYTMAMCQFHELEERGK